MFVIYSSADRRLVRCATSRQNSQRCCMRRAEMHPSCGPSHVVTIFYDVYRKGLGPPMTTKKMRGGSFLFIMHFETKVELSRKKSKYHVEEKNVEI